MANKEPSERTGYVENVKIIDVEKRYKSGAKHYVYVIQVTWSNPTNLFIVYRRYAQFFDLQCKLLDLFAETPVPSTGANPARQIPFLPGKIILGRSQIRQIALERKQALHEYCQSLISLPERISQSRPILEFFHSLPADVQQPLAVTRDEKKPAEKHTVVISGPSKLATYRCLADFTAADKLELSLKRNTNVQVLQKHANGWWFIQHGDQKGFVPGTYLQPSDLEHGARETETLEKASKETFVVNHSYECKNRDELSLEQGSFVAVIEKSLTGWWKVQFNDRTGYFPALYLSSCEGRHTPDTLRNGTSHANDSDWDDDDDDQFYSHPSTDTDPDLYYAHSDFTDSTNECFSFRRGDLIEIHHKHPSGWWYGRRKNGDCVLMWIPASFLQKDAIVTDAGKIASHHGYPPERNGIALQLVDRLQPKANEKMLTNATGQGTSSETAVEPIYATVVKKQQSVEPKPVHQTSSLSPADIKQVAAVKSVKDLVNKFNGQRV